MTEHVEFVAWRAGKGVPNEGLLAAMGPGLAPAADAPFVPAARWSEVAAAIAVRLLRAIAQVRAFQDHEANMLVHAIAAMAAGGEHDDERRVAALMAAANLGIVTRMGTARPPAVESALSWFPRALAWAARHACLDRKCSHRLPELAADAVAHHAALAAGHAGDAEAAGRAEQEAQRRDVEAALQGRAIALA